MRPLPVLLTPLVALTCLVSTPTEAKTVVSIPFPFTSHARYHTHVARALARRGHQVWVAIPTYLSEKGYLDTSQFRTIPYETSPGLEDRARQAVAGRYFEGKPEDFFEFVRISADACDLLLRNDSFLSTIRQVKPDLIILDNVLVFYSMSVLPYRLNIPFAFVGSSYIPRMVKIPFSPADVPFSTFPYSDHMTFRQRLHNFLFTALFAVYNPSFPTHAVSKYAPEMEYVPLELLVTRAEIFIVEIDHVLDYPKPTLPNVKLIGGTVTGPAKALPPDYRTFMDGAKEGVVIVSFGSYVLDLPQNISDKVLHVLLHLPFKSIFRSNLKSPDPKKIMMSPWIPQNDLLGHPHTKVFVSHCGKNGQYEALYHAVPIVATPLFIDQPYNAERVRVKGFAEFVDLYSCTAEQMSSTILKVANEPKYKEAIAKRSRLFKELYGVPMETAAYWLDHVMEYGGDYMRSAGQEMPMYQYMLLDVLFFILCVLTVFAAVICLLFYALCRCCAKIKLKAD